MKLVQFISDLIQKGQVTLQEEIQPFMEEDLEQTALFLASFYKYDAQNMPLAAPDFHAEAAVWAASYIYRSVQLILVRKHGDEVIERELQAYRKPKDAEAVYSADLCLRYLPQLFSLAKGISPNDPIILNLRQTAKDWPFSCVGVDLDEFEPLPPHPSLDLAFTDRIIAARDLKIAQGPRQQGKVRAALGAHGAALWPAFDLTEHTEK